MEALKVTQTATARPAGKPGFGALSTDKAAGMLVLAALAVLVVINFGFASVIPR